MPVTATAIAGLFVVERPLIEDARGFFRESFRLSEVSDAVGREVSFRQSNHSRSARGVLRGFHAEPWDKLVYIVRGTALCAVADVRPDSPTFGLALTFLLGDAPGNRQRLFISKGLANGFQVVEEADYVNEVSEEFTPENRLGYAWNDETLGVDWPIKDPILSAADRALPTLAITFGDLTPAVGGQLERA
ncbi:MAG TPA: dTDP-4-dehydrorhamnose 3,5-epimerase family protein [Galbitalea sp.]|jgi:dTDP-4-dehydrorhamnose 3,5-epimerase